MRWLRRFHLALGLLCLVPLLWVAATGLLLAIPWGHPDLPLSPSNRLTTQDLLQQTARLDTWFKESATSAVYWPQPERPVLGIARNKGRNVQWYAGPDLHRIAESDGALTPARRTLLKLHRGTYGQPWGKFVLSLSVLPTLALLGSGILYRLRRRKNITATRPLRTHRSLGIWPGIFIAVTLCTGALQNFISELMVHFQPFQVSQSDSKTAIDGGPPLSALLTIASDSIETSQLHSIYKQGHRILFYLNDNGRLYLEASTGSALSHMPRNSHWIHHLYPWHTFQWVPWKWARHLASALTAMALIALLWTGLQMRPRARYRTFS